MAGRGDPVWSPVHRPTGNDDVNIVGNSFTRWRPTRATTPGRPYQAIGVGIIHTK